MQENLIPNNEQLNYIQLAIKLAKDNVDTAQGGPFGAVIVKDGKVISAAANTVTHSNDPTAHAEVNAIRQACEGLQTFDLSGCEIYASCEPCPMCLSAIYWARISKLYYAADKNDAASAGFDDSFIYEELAKPENERSIKICRLTPNEAAEPFEKWKQSTERIEY